MEGQTENRFGVQASMTREDMAVILSRLMELLKTEPPVRSEQVQFADAKDISRYAEAAVAAMQRAGIIQGFEDGRFVPKGAATRAQAAVMIDRLLQ
ncbi:S-layer homology domain-containing protein [Paenibacillus algorifonticola]|uniref:S-layer homology domain-containing protein n=1 Tax=Paenibacillus algorifonticola TaxID=684063 RepID=A0A1I2IF69_9BACL|nr:S-layer homology domain-containing protein [Paenibacillus algorifonticola]